MLNNGRKNFSNRVNCNHPVQSIDRLDNKLVSSSNKNTNRNTAMKEVSPY